MLLMNRLSYLTQMCIGIGLVLLAHGCAPTIEEYLEKLDADFSTYQTSLQEMNDLLLILFKETDFSGFILGDGTKDRPHRVISNGSKIAVPLEQATAGEFQEFLPALNRIQQLGSQLKMAYAHVDTLPTNPEFLSVSISLQGGGVLGNDSGYMHLLGGKLSDYKSEGFWWKPIQGAPTWFGFVD